MSPSRLLKSPVSGRNHQPGPVPQTQTTMKRTTTHIQATVAAAALLLPALTACTAVTHTERASDEPIAFASFVPDVTKAVVEDVDGMENAFAVWGYRKPAEGDAADVQTVFDRDEVYRDGVTAPWTYDIPRFWLEGRYDFYALHPYPDGTDVANPAADAEVKASCIAGEGITIVLNSPKADIDLMTAAASRNYPGEGDGAVEFTFDHLLSRVSIQAEAGAGDVQITSLTFSGMYDGGSYNGSAWDFTGRIADGSIRSGVVDIAPGEPVSVLPDLLMIPQTPGSGCGITLTWTLDGTEQDPVTLTVPADPAWSAARHYIYTLKLNDVKDVALYINVRDWNERNYPITF